MSTPSKDTTPLLITTASLISLIRTTTTHLASPLQPPPPPDTSTQSPVANPFELSHDAASLLKAHTTKISLLLINPPFTPTAIERELRTVLSSVIPALAAAADLATPALLGRICAEEVRWRIRRLLTEFGGLVDATEKKARGREVERRGKDELAVTGLVWSAADAVAALRTLGVAGVLVQKVEGFKGLVVDALEELRAWRDDDADEGFDEGTQQEEEDDEGGLGVEKLELGATVLPADREDVREQLEVTLKLLGLLKTFLTAVAKHRLKTLPREAPGQELDSMSSAVERMSRLSGKVDEVAEALYDLDVEVVRERVKDLKSRMLRIVDCVKLPLGIDVEEDKFTEWCSRFEVAITDIGNTNKTAADS